MPNFFNRYRAYLSGFCLSLTAALPAYISSSYLATAAGERTVGFIYTIASLATILALMALPHALARRPRLTISLSLIITLAATLVLALTPDSTSILLAFIIYSVGNIVLHFIVDLELEHSSRDENTGSIRGAFLMIVNLGWFVSPFLAATLIGTGNAYSRVFAAAALATLPLLLLINRRGGEIRADGRSPFTTLKLLFWQGEHSDLARIISVDFLLQIFYAIMVIYIPLYLHETIGLGWPKIGIIFTWMLLPFVLLDYPLGLIADRYLGEKEILIGAIIIIAIATMSISFIASGLILVWAVTLFMTRVGAASIEAMKEIYLFKKITAADADVLALSRNLVPLSYIIAPLLATIFLFFLPLRFIFLALGLVMLLALFPALKLRDTK